VYLKHLTGPDEVTVSLRERNRPDVVYQSQKLNPSDQWSRLEFRLKLDPSQGASLEPLDFAVTVSNDTRVLVDQILLWPDDAVEGMDPEMVAMSRDLKTPIVRFGGNYTSAYHWRDGIGPMDKRVTMLNLAWGMPEYNQFGTDEFLAFCRLIGAEPQIALNLGTGTPAEAADWVQYVNGKWNGGKGGLVWELGNELWGDFQTGYPTISHIAERTRNFAEAVRRVDAKATLIATGQDPDHFQAWNAEQLQNARLFDYLSTHFVVGSGEVKTPGASAEFIARSAFALPVELERRLRAMRAQIQAVPDAAGRVGIAFTEWLFWARDDRGPRFTNMGGALCTAGMLNTLMRTADFTRISDMTGLIEFGGIWKKRGRVYGVPAYYAFRMYSTADASVPVEAITNSEKYSVAGGNPRLPDIADVPYLDIVAARNEKADRLTLFCVNRHLTRDLEARIDLKGFQAGRSAKIQTLSADSIYQANDEMDPAAVVPITRTVTASPAGLKHVFPASSVTVIEFRKE
jgi:alpha-N-arabinofuranosidase